MNCEFSKVSCKRSIVQTTRFVVKTWACWKRMHERQSASFEALDNQAPFTFERRNSSIRRQGNAEVEWNELVAGEEPN